MRKRILYIGNKLAQHGSTPTSIDTLGDMLEAEGYQLRYASTQTNPVLRLGYMLLSVLRFRHYDCVLIDTYSTLAFNYAWLTARLAAILKLKYIPILHGGDMPKRLGSSPQMCRQLFSNSLTNVAVSPYLQQHLKHGSYKSVLIPNSIDLAQYSYKERKIIKPCLLWVRAFHNIYNPQLAIRLIARISEIYPNAMLTMVGPEKDGSLAQCKELALDLGVEGKVNFTGKLTKSEWIELSVQHDMFINTTRFDNLPVSLIEAMALGLPIVSTNVGGMPFLIDHQTNGLLVEGDNVEAMYSAVEQLLEDPVLAHRIACKARKDAEQYDWNLVKHRWSNILQQT